MKENLTKINAKYNFHFNNVSIDEGCSHLQIILRRGEKCVKSNVIKKINSITDISQSLSFCTTLTKKLSQYEFKQLDIEVKIFRKEKQFAESQKFNLTENLEVSKAHFNLEFDNLGLQLRFKLNVEIQDSNFNSNNKQNILSHKTQGMIRRQEKVSVKQIKQEGKEIKIKKEECKSTRNLKWDQNLANDSQNQSNHNNKSVNQRKGVSLKCIDIPATTCENCKKYQKLLQECRSKQTLLTEKLVSNEIIISQNQLNFPLNSDQMLNLKLQNQTLKKNLIQAQKHIVRLKAEKDQLFQHSQTYINDHMMLKYKMMTIVNMVMQSPDYKLQQLITDCLNTNHAIT